ncbi:Uncharacterised protein [Vibrio cholerae]|nr:Uncharacterised protein [Vibrio cholerae]
MRATLMQKHPLLYQHCFRDTLRRSQAVFPCHRYVD